LGQHLFGAGISIVINYLKTLPTTAVTSV